MMVTVPEAARRTGRHPETVRRWIREGRLAAEKVGTQYLVDEGDLEAMVADVEVVPSRRYSTTATGEPMPNFVAALHRSRSGR